MIKAAPLQAAEDPEAARLAAEARRVTVARDDWGIAHIHGRTDADAVFGMSYAQAEDDFDRIERNYLTSLGRLAEAEGPSALFQDLRQRLFVDEAGLKARYAKSPPWLQALMTAWADGLNFYLLRHPETRPKVLTRFEPWMALSFSEGSIGGDIEKAPLGPLEAFYGGRPMATAALGPPPGFSEPKGSNGVAISPANTVNGRALLLINPHTSFYFRSELEAESDEGLKAYGAVTWGQFFIYQGFNERLGWMHTTSGLDAVDEFAETIVWKDGAPFYRFGADLLPVETSTVSLKARGPGGALAVRTFKVFKTRHGPIIRAEGGRFIAMSIMDRPVEALEQGFLLTKAKTYAAFMQAMAFKANSSNNTIYADADGHIAYLHPQFIPRRDDRFDYTLPVDGSDPATSWRGLHELDEAPRLLDPPNGWIMNTNDWPWSAAGASSPKPADFPRYMDQAGENARGVHARMLLEGRRDFTLEGLNRAAFDSYLPAFDQLLPPLFADLDALPASDPRKAALQGPMALLKSWDRRWSADSEATSLAVFWGQALFGRVEGRARAPRRSFSEAMAGARPEDRVGALAEAVAQLTRDFGGWRVEWGEINRFQRLSGATPPRFDDALPSLPVPFTSAEWGSLASFGARRYPGTRRFYGSSGNSFVAVVEFGPKVRAVAVTAGGESGHPSSPHFVDEAPRYASGALRPVYFYKEDLKGHVERVYAPGDEPSAQP
jgi:acyl-homoserine-lactone acylase